MKHLFVAGPLLWAAACAPDAPERPTYDEDVAPILVANCVRCHGAPSADADARHCVRVDLWDSTPDETSACPDPDMGGMVLGVHDSDEMLVDEVLSGRMPKDGPPLTDRQIEILERWRAAGFPRRSSNAAPTMQFVMPPATGATVAASYDIRYVVADPDGDAVTWSLSWSGGGRSGVFATGLAAGQGMLTVDTSRLASGTYTLTASLDDGSTSVSVAAAGALIVPAGRNAAPTVTVVAPNGGESFYTTQTVTVSWSGDDPDDAALTYDVVALHAGGSIPIKTGVGGASGQPASLSWSLTGVSPATDYRIQVTAHDGHSPSLSAVDSSDATFVVSGPPAQVSFASQVQPILTASCVGSACHDQNAPQQGLDLTAGRAYAELVGVASQQCGSTQRVRAGQPDQSYLVWKLQGSGGCYSGSRMPKGASALSAGNLQLIRDWIANGAPNN